MSHYYENSFQSCGDIHVVVSSSGRRMVTKHITCSWTSDVKHVSGNAHILGAVLGALLSFRVGRKGEILLVHLIDVEHN